MRHRFFLMIALSLLITTMNAESVKKVRLTFDKQQFSFINDEAGALEISSNALNVNYGSDTSQPGLPVMAVNVGIPDGVEFNGVSEELTTQLLFDDVVVAATEKAVPTNYDGVLPKKVLPTYSEITYPNKNVQYVCTSNMNGYTILRFLVCPFRYDAQGKKLYIASNVTLNIKLSDTPSVLVSETSFKKQNMRDVVMNQIVNPEDFVEEQVSTQGLVIGGDLSFYMPIRESYIIVTSEALAPYFKPLAQWKTQKGIRSKVATIEEITALHPEMDTPLAIKTYLRDEYENNNLKYVLLGGSDCIVPARKCYAQNSGTRDSAMPVDLYYACFGKNFSWDADGNNVYGEINDSISMTPDIFVTRAAVRKAEEARAFVNKVLGYEKEPKWNNNIMMCGAKLYKNRDAELEGEGLYKDCIAPYWNGERFRFYDTYTDAPNGADYDLTAENLQYELSRGYSFVEMISHGNRTLWQLEAGDAYEDKHADKLVNDKYTIITTTSCSTNMFDEKYRSLSEFFIRNPQSGVVAYLGCSRYGWVYNSTQYEKAFYKNLFSSKFINKKYGEIVAAAKSERINFCGGDNSDRWIQFGLNPLGDPEMPIYTETPKEFANVSVKFGTGNNSVTIDTGVDSCNVCFMTIKDEGKTAYSAYRYARNVTFQLPTPTSSVCITKQNYIPRVIMFLKRAENSAITKCVVNSSNMLTVSTQLPENIKDAKVIITSAMGETQTVCNVSTDTPTVSADLSRHAKGVQVVSLVIDGNYVDSKSITTK